MNNILDQINKVRKKIKNSEANTLISQKPFAEGMYRFSMFMISYYSRVSEQLKLDYDSFIIIQTVVSSVLYQLQKKTKSKSYSELEKEWANSVIETINNTPLKNNNKLTISSICLVTGLPKETVRRKVHNLCEKNILRISKKEGVLLGNQYKKIFENFVPQTVFEVSKLLKEWERTGVLKNLLRFKM